MITAVLLGTGIAHATLRDAKPLLAMGCQRVNVLLQGEELRQAAGQVHTAQLCK